MASSQKLKAAVGGSFSIKPLDPINIPRTHPAAVVRLWSSERMTGIGTSTWKRKGWERANTGPEEFGNFFLTDVLRTFFLWGKDASQLILD